MSKKLKNVKKSLNFIEVPTSNTQGKSQTNPRKNLMTLIFFLSDILNKVLIFFLVMNKNDDTSFVVTASSSPAKNSDAG